MTALGQELRRTYNDIIAEGVPERFAEILRKLDESSNEGGDQMTLILRKQHTQDRIEGAGTTARLERGRQCRGR